MIKWTLARNVIIFVTTSLIMLIIQECEYNILSIIWHYLVIACFCVKALGLFANIYKVL